MNKETKLTQDELTGKIEKLELILYATGASPKFEDWLTNPLQYWPQSWQLILDCEYIIKYAFFLYRNHLLRNQFINFHFENEEEANVYFSRLLEEDFEINGEKVDEDEFQMMIKIMKKMAYYFQYKWRFKI